MQNQRCPTCGGVLVFIVSTDGTLWGKQCEEVSSHLSPEQRESLTIFRKGEESMAKEWAEEMKLPYLPK